MIPNNNEEKKETKPVNNLQPKLSKSIVQSFVAGAISGTASSVLLQPFDLIKTRVQQCPSSSFLQAARNIARTEGVLGFWTGVTPSLWRMVPGIGLHFACYHTLTASLASDNRPLTSAQALVVGGVSRVFAGTLLIPVTVVKTRWEAGGDQFQYRGRGMLAALRTIFRVEGVAGLVSGLGPTIVRDAPYSGIYLLLYNKLKLVAAVAEMADTNTRSAAQFVCGLVAGAAATVVVQPADVVKTELQLRREKVRDREVVRQVYAARGLRGFFVGLLPRLIRKSLMSALSWTVYERLTAAMLTKL